MGASPSLPIVSTSEISGAVEVGRVFSIRARVTPDPARFSINLMCSNGDIAFHFNPRFDEESPVIICNTWTNKTWGAEDRTLQVPFRPGEPFEMTITVQHAYYEVCVNGAYLLKYAHRLPLHTVNKLECRGGIKFEENVSTLPQVDPPPYRPPFNGAPDSRDRSLRKAAPGPADRNNTSSTDALEMTNLKDPDKTPNTDHGLGEDEAMIRHGPGAPSTGGDPGSALEGCCFCRLFVRPVWLRWTKWRIGGDFRVHMRKV